MEIMSGFRRMARVFMVGVIAVSAGFLAAPQTRSIADESGPAAATPPVDDASGEQLGRIQVLYESPKTPELQEVFERLKRHQVLETIQQMLSPLRLPAEGLLIKTLECGIDNAWYNTDGPGDTGPTVHMCYEMLQDIVKNVPTEDVRPNVTRHDAIVGQFLFWTLHETGHAVFDIFQLPVFGREEDAADLFSGYMMLHFGKDQARRWVEGAAYTADFGSGNNYASVHGLPRQRFFNLICLAYGADPVTFADVTNNMVNNMTQPGDLPEQRAKHCAHEFETMDHAFKVAIAPHVDQVLAGNIMDRTWFAQAGRRDLIPVDAAARPVANPTSP
jgi:hypothetical protein